MDFILISVIVFFMSLLIIELSRYAYRNLDSTKKSKVKKRIRKYVIIDDGLGSIEKQRKLSDIPLFNNLLLSIPLVVRLDRLAMQAHAKQPMSVYVLFSLLLGFAGSAGVMLYSGNGAYAVLAGLTLFSSPYLYLLNLKQKRTRKFEEQFHEGLDLVARALKAGHSFTASMKLAADEFKDPLGTEFTETIEEINFGISVPVALKNLAERVDCKAVNYFVMAVIIQRDTGGNLAELIESLAHLIREKFKFEGKVRVLSAEGRVSAIILIMIPFGVAGYIQLSSPGFIAPLFEEPVGRLMLIIAGVMMVVGSIILARMVKIEV